MNAEWIKEGHDLGLDIHTYVASKMFACKYEDVTPQLRAKAKVANFLILYSAQNNPLLMEHQRKSINNLSKKFSEVSCSFEQAELAFLAWLSILETREIIKSGDSEINVTFKGGGEEVLKKQRQFIKMALRDGLYRGVESIIVDNVKVVKGSKAVCCFIDFTTANCGYSNPVPSEFAQILLEISNRQKPKANGVKLHWLVVYKGQQLPNRNWPYRGGGW